MRKLSLTLAAAAFLAGNAIAEYPIFPLTGTTTCWAEDNVCSNHQAFGNYIMGFAYNGAQTGNVATDPSAGCAEDNLSEKDKANGRSVYNATDNIAELTNVVFDGVKDKDYPGASIGIKLGSKCDKDTGKKITDCKDGITYEYKGDYHWFILEFPKTHCTGPGEGEDGDDGFDVDFYNNKWGKQVGMSKADSWTPVEIYYDQLGNSNEWGRCFGTDPHPTVNLEWVDQIVWTVDEALYTHKTESPLNLAIKNVKCLEAGDSPILVKNAPLGLTVALQARSLQVSAAKEGTVSLFDMSGKQAFSQKVSAGQSTINLNSQKTGVYYVVLSSGSQKQTFKVVLK
jgi:hypothetical protein